MASSKQKTTWSKIQRESAKREKRAEKAARKVARRLEQAEPSPVEEFAPEGALLEGEDAGQDDPQG